MAELGINRSNICQQGGGYYPGERRDAIMAVGAKQLPSTVSSLGEGREDL